VPTKKQKRRREKSRRHEYEYVYVDDEGNEVEVDPEEPKPARRDRERDKPKAGAGRATARRPVRPVPPPSWQRVGKRLLIFAPLMYVVFYLTNKGASDVARLAYTIGYSLLFVPFLYWIDWIAYRRYLRQIGQDPPPGPRLRRR
jgi:hypothetical protein